jgi:hypothetical protein
MLTLYGPAVPFVGQFTDVTVVALSLVYAYANLKYVDGYMSSADGRMPMFKLRTNAFKGLAFGSMIAMAFSLSSMVL